MSPKIRRASTTSPTQIVPHPPKLQSHRIEPARDGPTVDRRGVMTYFEDGRDGVVFDVVAKQPYLKK